MKRRGLAAGGAGQERWQGPAAQPLGARRERRDGGGFEEGSLGRGFAVEFEVKIWRKAVLCSALLCLGEGGGKRG